MRPGQGMSSVNIVCQRKRGVVPPESVNGCLFLCLTPPRSQRSYRLSPLLLAFRHLHWLALGDLVGQVINRSLDVTLHQPPSHVLYRLVKGKPFSLAPYAHVLYLRSQCACAIPPCKRQALLSCPEATIAHPQISLMSSVAWCDCVVPLSSNPPRLPSAVKLSQLKWGLSGEFEGTP